MKLDLKDYQASAVAEVLKHLGDARFDVERGRKVSLALTAPTGAGKTVMAAAVIESLFFGNGDLGVDRDETATVLWFTSDPSLNEQTRFRLMQASEKLTSRNLEVVPTTFSDEQLKPGRVYFLNSQKLSSNSLLVKGAGAGEDGEMLIAPDLRARTFWEVLANTIDDPRTTLYLILDEAHIGMNTSSRDLSSKPTIVKQLVNGEAGAPPVPIVLGISATVKRFTDAMANATGRVQLPNVEVDPVLVQESGLLKDQILLSFPAESGDFSTTLLREAVARIQESDRLWEAYAVSPEGAGAPRVLPLLVVQMPNTPDDQMMLDAVETVLHVWPEIDAGNIAHVFGERTPLRVGGHEIAYVKPEDVAEREHVRVLFAKDAVSTGWDCPRAEVLVSFRSAQDDTHITQLLGRMVRTPLARRIPGDDRLNSVECLLPRFNRSAAENVVRRLNGAESLTPIALTAKTATFGVNPHVPDLVWEVFDTLPTTALPRAGSRPVNRFTRLAHLLAADGLRPGAHTEAIGELVRLLQSQAVLHAPQVEAQIDDLRTFSGETIVVTPGTTGYRTEAIRSLILSVDGRALDSDFRQAQRVLSPQVALPYAETLEEIHQDDFFEAHLRTAALARVPEALEALEAYATQLFETWDAEHRVAIKGLPDASQEEYARLRASAGEPTVTEIRRPRTKVEVIEDEYGGPVPMLEAHLLSDADGRFPIAYLNEWERDVVLQEAERSLAWYRNPSHGTPDSLAIAWKDSGVWRRLCPDFLFFSEVRGEVKTSVVDPHGVHLADAIPKLHGLAQFAVEQGTHFHRIESVAEVDGVVRVLDLTDVHVRSAVLAATDAVELYRSPVASDYR